MPRLQNSLPSDSDLHHLISNPLFRQLLDSLSISVCITDLSGTILYFSRKAYEMYKLAPTDSAEGRKIDDLFLTGSAGTLDVLNNSQQNQINAVFFNGVEGIARRYPIFDENGDLMGCLSEALTTTHDVRLDELIGSFQHLKRQVSKKNVREDLSSFGALAGESLPMQKMKAIGHRFAQSEQPVLVIGESGTGKELVAQAIHKASPRASGPFISVNCAALPHDLAESELFGYVEGSFTGSSKGGRKGLFESADKGTMFLDEIGELPLSIQAKLLRVLESKEIQKIGQRSYVHSDFRLIAATNRNLPELVQKKRFREDLYHRLNILELKLPPLRDHLEDLPILIAQLIQGICGPQKALDFHISAEVMDIFVNYHWPGNVRELKNVLAYAYCRLAEEGGLLTPDYLPERLLEGKSLTPATKNSPELSFRSMKSLSEKEGILMALNMANNNKSKAARLLGISRNTLYLKLKALGLDGKA